MSSRVCIIPRISTRRRPDRPFLSKRIEDAFRLEKRASIGCLSMKNSGDQYRPRRTTPHLPYDEKSRSSGVHTASDNLEAMRNPSRNLLDREFDTVPLIECVRALRELHSYGDMNSTQNHTCSSLQKQLTRRLVYLVMRTDLSGADNVEVLDSLLDVYDKSESVSEACNRIITRCSDWLNYPRVFWKLKGKPGLTQSVSRVFSDPEPITELISHHSSCLVFKSRLLDLMISSRVPVHHLRQVIASICETLENTPRERLQPKPLYSTLIDLSNMESSEFWTLAESKRLISTMLAAKCFPKLPGPATLALSNGIIQTGGIRVHRSPVVYQILTDSLGLYRGIVRKRDLLLICFEYKLPSTLTSGFFPRQKASIAASVFLENLISQFVSSSSPKSLLADLPHFAKLLATSSVEIKSSICLWSLVHNKILDYTFCDPTDCIAILVAAEQASPIFETIERSLLPQAILGMRRYLDAGGSVVRLAREVSKFPAGKVSRRIVEELVEHVIGRLRLQLPVPCEDVVGILLVKTERVDAGRVSDLQKYLFSRIVSDGDQVDRETDFWIDILRVTNSEHLAEFALAQVDVSCLSIEQVIAVSKWIREDHVEWKDRAMSLVSPEDRDGDKTVCFLTQALRRKHERLEQYADFPDGKGDGNIAGAFCGFFFSLGLSTHFLGFSN